MFIAPDYAGVIEAMRFNKVHIAWFGNKSAIEAVNRAGGEVFVQTVDVTGNPGYWSLRRPQGQPLPEHRRDHPRRQEHHLWQR